MKEFFRKRLVSLKRSPQNIPLVALLIAFLTYSLNLGIFSETLGYIQGPSMGISEFATMLFSILIFVVFMNSFPKRKKPNFVMIGLTYLLLAVIIVADFNYRNCIVAASQNEKFAGAFEKNPCINQSLTVITVHIVLLIVVAVLIALIPVYGKQLKKINTNIDVEYSNNLGKIDVDEE